MQINGITLAGITKQNKGEKVNNICDKQGAEGERVFFGLLKSRTYRAIL
jgi:hypothetical protein